MMKSILYLLSALTLSAIALPERAAADEIAWKDYQYQDVYIRATGAMLYVMRPQTGDVITVRRSAVPDSAWKISEDTAHRAALLASWNRAQEAKKDSAPGGAQAAHVAAEDVEPAIEAAPSPRPGALRTSGVPLLRLKGVPLETALQASLRSRNLDYRIDGDIIYVGRPQQLREVPGERLETRQYTLNSGLLATLPKIVVQSGGMRQLQPQAGFGGASSGYPGASGVASGYGSAGPGGGGGFGQGRFGGYGGGGYGGGGYGGGGGLQPDVTALSNISDLFSNIDDRRVGEPRAVVGSGLFFSTTSRNKYE